jgi:RNA 2',3'-cyclic 3'-phosphodiesterase
MFVALDLPEPAKSELASWRDDLVAGRDDLRPVAAEVLHVTLAFLAWQNERDAGAIATAAFEAAAAIGAPRVTPAGLRPLPPRAPRLFALDLDDEDGRAVALQGAVSDALAAGRWYRPEKRPFWPHVTLARVKRGRRAAPLEGPPPPPEPFDADVLTLYRSTLRPQGAVYEPLERATLGG